MRIVFVLLFSCAFSCFSQTEGYVISINNDTLYGKVHFNDSTQIVSYYKDADSAAVSTYSSRELKGFLYKGKRHIRFPFYPKNIDGLSSRDNSPNPNYAFYQEMVFGFPFSLFVFYHNATQRTFYILRTANNRMIELPYCPCKNGDHFFTEDHNYFRNRLYNLAAESGCKKKYLRRIETATIYDLEELIQQIDGIYLEDHRNELRRAFLFLSAGRGISALQILEDYQSSYYHGKSTSIGIGGDIWKAYETPRLKFRSEFGLQFYNYGDFSFPSLYYAFSLNYHKYLSHKFGFAIGTGYGGTSRALGGKKKEIADRYLHGSNVSNGVIVRCSINYWNRLELEGLTKLTTSVVDMGPKNTFFQISLAYHFKQLGFYIHEHDSRDFRPEDY